MTITNDEIADMLDRAHDEMLVRGRTTGMFVDRTTGKVCLVGAIIFARSVPDTEHICDVQAAAQLAMQRRGYSPTWNDHVATDDDVLEAFRVVAKELRNGGVA